MSRDDERPCRRDDPQSDQGTLWLAGRIVQDDDELQDTIEQRFTLL
jgi:hypothetical protein